MNTSVELPETMDDEDEDVDIEMSSGTESKVTDEFEEDILSIQHEILSLNTDYVENLTELFFLENQGCLMDYFAWKKKATHQLKQYLNIYALDNQIKSRYARVDVNSISTFEVIKSLLNFNTKY